MRYFQLSTGCKRISVVLEGCFPPSHLAPEPLQDLQLVDISSDDETPTKYSHGEQCGVTSEQINALVRAFKTIQLCFGVH